MVPAGSRRVSPAPRYSGSRLAVLPLRVQDCHLLRSSFPDSFRSGWPAVMAVLQPRPCRSKTGLGYSPFARHYLGNHSLFSFPAPTEMFQFEAFASPTLLSGIPPAVASSGLPHSDIRGSQLFCSSPQLIAALHVLHRRLVPRHPPCAVTCFHDSACPTRHPAPAGALPAICSFARFTHIHLVKEPHLVRLRESNPNPAPTSAGGHVMIVCKEPTWS